LSGALAGISWNADSCLSPLGPEGGLGRFGRGRSMDANDARRRSERSLVGVSLAQLTCGLTGMAVAIQRGHAYDVGFAKGTSERVARDSILSGTAFSAPATMLAAQAVFTAVVAARGSARAAAGLQVLGALMTSGYLAERLVRHRLGRRGWEWFESPLVAAGVGLSVAMSLLGRQTRAHAR
jgi:hypothetical protein